MMELTFADRYLVIARVFVGRARAFGKLSASQGIKSGLADQYCY